MVDESIVGVEEQDDQVAAAVYALRNTPLDRTHIPVLTDKTFPTETENMELLMVSFYLKGQLVTFAGYIYIHSFTTL